MTEDGTPLSAGAILGYVRVSTSEQVLDRQRDALLAAGCTRLFEDEGISGAKKSRPGLDELLAYARAGDQIVVQSLDRLGRRTVALLELVEDLRQREISLRILNLGIDTSTPAGELVLTMMAALAQLERSILVERTKDGLEAARRRGRVGGRPSSLSVDQREEVVKMLAEGRPVAEIARLMRCSDRTVARVRDSASV